MRDVLMMRSLRSILPVALLPSLLLVATMASPARAAATWTMQKDASRIGFTAFQKEQPVEGSFAAFKAEIVFDEEELAASRVNVEIDAASIDTGHKDRDATLRGSSFFDVEEWPAARFESDELVHKGGNSYEAKGRLTMRDVTKDVTLPFELTIKDHPSEQGVLLAEADGEISISRLEFGIGQGEFASTSTVADKVVIRIEIDATHPR
jgi:polyisoprenoid-binding protein YceI